MPEQMDPRYGTPRYGFGMTRGEPIPVGASEGFNPRLGQSAGNAGPQSMIYDPGGTYTATPFEGGGAPAGQSLNALSSFVQGGGRNLGAVAGRGAPARGGGFMSGGRNPGGGYGRGYMQPNVRRPSTGGVGGPDSQGRFPGQPGYIDPGADFGSQAYSIAASGQGAPRRIPPQPTDPNYQGPPGYIFGTPEGTTPWMTTLDEREPYLSPGGSGNGAWPGEPGYEPGGGLIEGRQEVLPTPPGVSGQSTSATPVRPPGEAAVGSVRDQLDAYARQIGGGAPGWDDANVGADVISGIVGRMGPEAGLNALKSYYAQMKQTGSNPYDAFTRGHTGGSDMVRQILTGSATAPSRKPAAPKTPLPGGTPVGGIVTPKPGPKVVSLPPRPGMTVGGGATGGAMPPREGVGDPRKVPGGLNPGGEHGGTTVGTTGGTTGATGGAGGSTGLVGPGPDLESRLNEARKGRLKGPPTKTRNFSFLND